MNRKTIFRQICQRAMEMTQRAAVPDLDFHGTQPSDPTCAYRSPFGPCLIGSLITDKAYHEDIEHNGVHEEVVLIALKESNIKIRNSRDIDFLDEIQSAHDGIDDNVRGDAFQQELRYNLKAVANKFNVPFPAFYKSIK